MRRLRSRPGSGGGRPSAGPPPRRRPLYCAAMLATLTAALHLLLAAPVPITPGDLSPQEGKLPDEPTQPESNPPLPSKPGAQQPPPEGGSQGTPATPEEPTRPPAE